MQSLKSTVEQVLNLFAGETYGANERQYNSAHRKAVKAIVDAACVDIKKIITPDRCAKCIIKMTDKKMSKIKLSKKE
jgi:hypothetical protein